MGLVAFFAFGLPIDKRLTACLTPAKPRTETARNGYSEPRAHVFDLLGSFQGILRYVPATWFCFSMFSPPDHRFGSGRVSETETSSDNAQPGLCRPTSSFVRGIVVVGGFCNPDPTHPGCDRESHTHTYLRSCVCASIYDLDVLGFGLGCECFSLAETRAGLGDTPQARRPGQQRRTVRSVAPAYMHSEGAVCNGRTAPRRLLSFSSPLRHRQRRNANAAPVGSP